MTIWALHGFLGLPSDFESLRDHCLQLRPDLTWNSVDYLRLRELSSNQSLKDWGAHFNRYVQRQANSEDIHVLLGYSQGGRLALNALQGHLSRWNSCILLSANPGISEGEKPLRLQNDLQWAQKFLNENFSRTVQQWNSQSVFQGSQTEPIRQEQDFNRRQLADCLDRWSIARQENFHGFLAQSTVPVLYVAGEKDTKYNQIGATLARLNRQVEFEKILQSGHRVLFDQPSKLAERIIRFLNQKSK